MDYKLLLGTVLGREAL